jgi:hypothetical protein
MKGCKVPYRRMLVRDNFHGIQNQHLKSIIAVPKFIWIFGYNCTFRIINILKHDNI